MNVGLTQASAHAIPLRDEIVQTVVTSPPYWGLRSYSGEQRFVWGGDAEHEHEWGEATRTPWANAVPGPSSNHPKNGAAGHWTPKETGPFCACGAWYGALGLEPTPELYVEHMVAIFREVRRVLRPDGTVWLNLGDSYAAGGNGARDPERWPKQSRNANGFRSTHSKAGSVLAPKNLVGIPWRVAFALQEDGWILRCDVIWSKPNPMPESATDRPTKAHEYLFLLTKSGDATYWTHRDHAGTRSRPEPDYRWQERRWDVERTTAVDIGPEMADEPDEGWRSERIGPKGAEVAPRWRRINLWRGHDYFYDADAVREPHKTADDPRARVDYEPKRGRAVPMPDGDTQRIGTVGPSTWPTAGRNLRTVWEIATQPYPGAHFATYPEKLVEPCILAGSSPQACAVCGAPWARVVERRDQGWDGSRYGERAVAATGGAKTGGTAQSTLGSSNGRLTGQYETTGWQPTCEHDDGSGASVVLDPFNGSGTTGRVAIRHGRSYIGLDVSREYLVEQSQKRMTSVQMVAPL